VRVTFGQRPVAIRRRRSESRNFPLVVVVCPHRNVKVRLVLSGQMTSFLGKPLLQLGLAVHHPKTIGVWCSGVPPDDRARSARPTEMAQGSGSFLREQTYVAWLRNSRSPRGNIHFAICEALIWNEDNQPEGAQRVLAEACRGGEAISRLVQGGEVGRMDNFPRGAQHVPLSGPGWSVGGFQREQLPPHSPHLVREGKVVHPGGPHASGVRP